MDAPRTETPITLQRDQWERKLLKKAGNSDIAYWLEQNRITQRCDWKGEVTNMLMRLTMQEEIVEQSDKSFFTKIERAKRTTIRDRRTNDGSSDLAEHNKEPTD